MSALRILAQASFAIVLALLWALNFPFHQVSEYIGASFPWPAKGSPMRIPSLLLEGLLAQAAVCIPAGLIVYAAVREKATTLAIGLASVFWLRVAFDLAYRYAGDSRLESFAVYQAVVHSVLLVGTVEFLRRFSSSNTSRSLDKNEL